ncbi:hypothetical protein O0L34_g18690 [Tuta absoluta]|nr:hypothetical protein O0L34_g18690 [Tuta absoluta]
MCSNPWLLESFECYMEDLIECFEGFVKKALFIITLAASIVIAIAIFFLKNIKDRNFPSRRSCYVGGETQVNHLIDSSLDNPVNLKKNISSITRKSRLARNQNSFTNIKKPLFGSRQSSPRSSQESLRSRSSVSGRGSTTSIVCKKPQPCPMKSPSVCSGFCPLIPLSPSSLSCKECKTPTYKRVVGSTLCARKTLPIPYKRQPSNASRKFAIPNLVVCSPPTCRSQSVKPCFIPKRVTSKPYTNIDQKKTC